MPATGRGRPRRLSDADLVKAAAAGGRPISKLFSKQQRAFLAEKGLDLSGEQQTKTRTALRYYTRTG